MTVYTDSPQFATAFLAPEVADGFVPSSTRPIPPLEPLLARVFRGPARGELHSAPLPGLPWSPPSCFLSSSVGSQYDLLIDLARGPRPASRPDRLRGWIGIRRSTDSKVVLGLPPRGTSIWLSTSPRHEIPRFEVAFTILAPFQ